MGLVLDSTVLIASERAGKSARQTLQDIASRAPKQDIALSVMTAMELMHGVMRANSEATVAKRRQFLHELLAVVPIYPITLSLALRAGRIDGENALRGVRLSLADLLIGATALELGYRVATANVRHFQRISGLEIVPF